MKIIDGKLTAQSIKNNISELVKRRKSESKKIPHLTTIIVGSDPASQTYVNSKIKNCAKVGFNSSHIELPEDTTEEQLLHEIDLLNNDPEIDGFIVQLPLPKHIDEQKIIMAIKPEKDVDGFHPVNVGKMTLELPTMLPATPYGILELLKAYNIETSGKHVVVVGRSHIVGRPMSILMSQKREYGNATVTIAHSRTKKLSDLIKTADILIAALGKPEFIKGDMLKDGVVIIDVGIHRITADNDKGYKITGDVNFDEAKQKASYITPVPGGVGPMTIAMLLQNTLLAADNNK